ncbi:hypothetical protein [Ornithobacterium rhinotracheale]|uniref:hypothetical protein n=1 Tax=Ornithobacterium rhinotracheale TaxID=28251 RepID=UPI003FD2A703
MKNLLKVALFAIFAIFSLVIVSCSSDDDGGSNVKKIDKPEIKESINPPAWMYGNWIADDVLWFKVEKGKFYILNDDSFIEIRDYAKELNKIESPVSLAVTLKELKESNHYRIEGVFKDSDLVAFGYDFKKIDNNNISWCNPISNVGIKLQKEESLK